MGKDCASIDELCFEAWDVSPSRTNDRVLHCRYRYHCCCCSVNTHRLRWQHYWRLHTVQGLQLQKLSITEALSYRTRIALPPNARAIVELRAGSTDDGPVIAEYRMELKGKRVPLPFQLVVSAPRSCLSRTTACAAASAPSCRAAMSV